jgi:hypothetical protein
MKPLLAGAIAGAVVAAGLATPVSAAAALPAPERPCGGYTLWATNAASADTFDANGDRLECWANEPYIPPGRDNKKVPRDPAGYKFYSYGSGGTGVTSVSPKKNRFTAYVLGQEDDLDMNGCGGAGVICFEQLTYDKNDRFYVDFAKGSRLVGQARFEAALVNADRFSMIYAVKATKRSVFSLDLAHSS